MMLAEARPRPPAAPPSRPGSASLETAAATVPDLLHAVPASRIDVEHTKLAMALAFASGVSGGLFGDALDAARLAPSTWDPKAYAGDLFLAQLVALCFQVRTDGVALPVSTRYLTRLLASPPEDAASIEHRRAILAELASAPSLRRSLERLHRALGRFRTLLEGATVGRSWDANRRQIDVLTAAKEIFDTMATGFSEARSGLSRLAAFGRRVQAGEPYRSLADLLAYDENLAELNLKVRVGADGKIRGFEVLAVQSDDANPFTTSPLRRWLAKLELFVRGFHFGEAEVMARLIDAVYDGVQDDLVPFVQLLGDVELLLGALGFRDLARAAGLEVCLPTFVGPEEPRALEGLFNPLLLAHGITPVPCDLGSDRQDVTTLVTGPNSGGKTRLLQSIGLAQLLAQGGVFVPARSASMALASGLVVSLIQETRADQAEGRLGMELLRIRELFEQLPPDAVVLLDELCSGTNPSEGEEIFELVLRMLTRLRPSAYITTHFLAFASGLERERRIEELRFLQVALGPDQEPTYQFAPGVAQTSLAGQAARRLGVTGDQLLALLEKNLAVRLARPAAPASLARPAAPESLARPAVKGPPAGPAARPASHRS